MRSADHAAVLPSIRPGLGTETTRLDVPIRIALASDCSSQSAVTLGGSAWSCTVPRAVTASHAPAGLVVRAGSGWSTYSSSSWRHTGRGAPAPIQRPSGGRALYATVIGPGVARATGRELVPRTRSTRPMPSSRLAPFPPRATYAILWAWGTASAPITPPEARVSRYHRPA